MRTLVFIPAWNEEASVAEVIADVRERLPEADLLVVDDGSTDATAARAREAGALVASLPFNQGLGAALQTGYLYALREGYDFCAHLDADGQHPPREVARLLEEVDADRADLVIGSRYRDPGAGRERRLQADALAADRHQRLPLLPHPGDAPALHRHDQRHAGGEPPGDGAVQRALLARLRRDRVAAAGGAPGPAGRGGAGADAGAGRRQLLPDAAALGLLHLQGPDRAAGRPVPAAPARRRSDERAAARRERRAPRSTSPRRRGSSPRCSRSPSWC